MYYKSSMNYISSFTHSSKLNIQNTIKKCSTKYILILKFIVYYKIIDKFVQSKNYKNIRKNDVFIVI